MAKVIQIIDVNSVGHTVRLSDGSTAFLAHRGQGVNIGDDFEDLPVIGSAGLNGPVGAEIKAAPAATKVDFEIGPEGQAKMREIVGAKPADAEKPE